MTEPKLKPCPWCDGKGKKYLQVFNETMECAYCNGTGKLPITNEEYIKSLNTEQLAEFIDGIARDGGDAIKRSNKSLIVYKHNFWEEWLKQPHKE